MGDYEQSPKEKYNTTEVEETGVALTGEEWIQQSKTVSSLENFIINHRLKEGKSYSIQIDGKKQILQVKDTMVIIFDEKGNTLWESTKRPGLSALL